MDKVADSTFLTMIISSRFAVQLNTLATRARGQSRLLLFIAGSEGGTTQPLQFAWFRWSTASRFPREPIETGESHPEYFQALHPWSCLADAAKDGWAFNDPNTILITINCHAEFHLDYPNFIVPKGSVFLV